MSRSFLKNFLVFTNPITIIIGVPVLTGIMISALLDGTVRKTKYVIKNI